MLVMLGYYAYYKRGLFSLFIDICEIYFFNMNISVTTYIIFLKLSPCILNVLLEGSISQILYSGPSFYFMAKKQVTFCLFLECNIPHFIS